MNAFEAYVEGVLRGQEGPRIAAMFDFDGTLVDGQSITAFLPATLPTLPARLLDRLRRPGIPSAELMRELVDTGLPLARLLASAWLGGRDGEGIRSAYQLTLRLCAGTREVDMRRVGERVFTETLASRLRAGLWALVQAHQRMGHTIVLVSAATRYQLAPMAGELGIEHVLCTELEVADGRVTGRLSGPLLYGKAKAAAVRTFAEAHDIDLESSYAYADTLDDVPFLETVGRPCVVNPGAPLANLAADRGWDVLRPDPGRLLPAALASVRSMAAYGGLVVGAGTGLCVGVLGADGRRAAELGVLLASDTYLGLAGVRLRVEGAEYLRSSRPAVFLFNHQSPLDLAIMIKLLGQDYTGFAKAELAATPGLSQLGRLMDVTFVDRDAKLLSPDLLKPALACLARGLSLVVAPEGTRSRTPMPGPFKKGGFLVARKAGVPVVPIVIRNAGQLMARNAWTVRSGLLEVVVHEPIDVRGWKIRELETRIEQVRQLYLDTLVGIPKSSPHRTPGDEEARS
ncbi:HAD-IB family hydrolase [Nocardia sp. NPDC051570]|uniref:HAD-IB family hydrolase n=1 Tax=Nocardia sp. NPDC051570 TaxID=3364324 RepID=UPI00379FB6A7